MSLEPGSAFGPYEVVALLGAGGMGEVYRARDPKLNRDVAIKVLPAHFAADADRLARFKREAQVLAALNHPNIAAIHEMASGADGVSALVMELVEGEDLAEIIGAAGIPLADALPIARQIADALDAAHEAGIVHRDLKPANIKVRADGTVKVLDFGLASIQDPGTSGVQDASNSPTLTARATQMGMIIGTAAYMAPEQAKGKAVDKRADVWAFGVVLYEMLTGHRAFKGEDVSDVLASVLKDNIGFDALPADTPTAVRRLLRRCLERDRSKRLNSMQVARLELEDSRLEDLDSAPAVSKTTAPKRSVLVPVVIAAVVTGLAAAGVVWRVMQPQPPKVQRFSLTPLPGAPIYVDVNQHDFALLPDGSGFVYSSRVGEESQLVVRRFDQFEGTSLPSAKLGASARGFAVSPDSQWLAYQAGPPSGADARLWKIPIAGGAPVPIASLPGNVRGAHWVREDRIVYGAAGMTGGIFSVSSSGGTPEVLSKPSAADGERDHTHPHELPDGKHILFAIMRVGGSDIGLLARDTGKWRVLIKDGMAPRYVPTGHIVYGSRGTLRAVRFSLETLEVSGDPIEVQQGVISKASGAVDFDVSATGVMAYLPGSHSERDAYQLAWRQSGKPDASLKSSLDQMGGLSLSPDGRFAAAIAGLEATRGLWLVDLDRDLSTQLPTGAGELRPPLVWNAEGTKVAYAVIAGTGADSAGIFQIAIAGTTPPERLTTAGPETGHLPSSWTPGGRGLVFTQVQFNVGTDVRLWTPGTPPIITVLIPASERVGANRLSPDGRWLAYAVTDPTPRLFVRPFPDVNTARIPVADYGQGVLWSRDSREMFFFDRRHNPPVVMVVPVAPAPSATIGRPAPFQLLRDFTPGWVVEPVSSQRVLLARRPVAESDTPTEYHVVLNWTEELKARVK